jgi:predicted transcriptional regulator
MSMTEILEELSRLARVEREKVWQRLEEIELEEIEETPEMLAAIDAGRRSIREGKATTIEEARKLLAQWITKSS